MSPMTVTPWYLNVLPVALGFGPAVLVEPALPVGLTIVDEGLAVDEGLVLGPEPSTGPQPASRRPAPASTITAFCTVVTLTRPTGCADHAPRRASRRRTFAPVRSTAPL